MDLFSLGLNQWPRFGGQRSEVAASTACGRNKKSKTKMKTKTLERLPSRLWAKRKEKLPRLWASTRFPDVVAGGQRSKIKVQGCGRFPRTGSRSALRAFLTGGRCRRARSPALRARGLIWRRWVTAPTAESFFFCAPLLGNARRHQKKCRPRQI